MSSASHFSSKSPSRSRLPTSSSMSTLTGPVSASALRKPRRIRSPSPIPPSTPNNNNVRSSKSPSRIPIVNSKHAILGKTASTPQLQTPYRGSQSKISPTIAPTTQSQWLVTGTATGSRSRTPTRTVTSTLSTPIMNSKTTKISPTLTSQTQLRQITSTTTTSSVPSKNFGLKRLEALARGHNEQSPLKRGRNGEPVPDPSTTTSTLPSTTHNWDPWVQKYQPRNLTDHFVHKKKVEEFQNWLTNPRGSNMCLLTGPSGSGKTGTVHLVANELGYIVREWLNPMTLATYNNPENVETLIGGREDEVVFGRSQFKSQEAAKTKKLILVEDFPTFFTRETPLLHQLIRNYKLVGECPLVFVLSDSSSMDLNSNKLFPKILLAEAGVQQITFNSIAQTLLHKFVSNILSHEGIVVDKSVVDDIVVASAGDMRWAINNLQFRLQKPKSQKGSGSTFKKPAKKKDVKTGTGKPKTDGEGGRDECLFLFHAIGKVLYCKRDPNLISTEELQLPPSRQKEQRVHPTIEVPENIGAKVGVGPETFFHFLGQNYLSFFGSLDDIVQATSYMSDANYIFSSWVSDGGSGGGQSYKNMELREELGLSISIRGLMHSNTARVGSSWKPLRKPGHTELNSRTQTMRESARTLFGGSITRDDFFPDLLPFYANRHFSSTLNSYQLDFVKQYGALHGSGSLGKGKQTLDEGEVVEIDDTIGGLNISPDKNSSVPVLTSFNENCDSIEPGPESEDEYMIEDYDED